MQLVCSIPRDKKLCFKYKNPPKKDLGRFEKRVFLEKLQLKTQVVWYINRQTHVFTYHTTYSFICNFSKNTPLQPKFFFSWFLDLKHMVLTLGGLNGRVAFGKRVKKNLYGCCTSSCKGETSLKPLFFYIFAIL